MNSSNPEPTSVEPIDPDLVEQAVPGHGIPSQDRDPAAQVLLSPEESERESKSVMMGGGLVAGSATGAAIGAAVAGPVGVLIGVTVGAAIGALGGVGATELVNQESTTNAEDELEEAKNAHRDNMPR